MFTGPGRTSREPFGTATPRPATSCPAVSQAKGTSHPATDERIADRFASRLPGRGGCRALVSALLPAGVEPQLDRGEGAVDAPRPIQQRPERPLRARPG